MVSARTESRATGAARRPSQHVSFDTSLVHSESVFLKAFYLEISDNWKLEGKLFKAASKALPFQGKSQASHPTKTQKPKNQEYGKSLLRVS